MYSCQIGHDNGVRTTTREEGLLCLEVVMPCTMVVMLPLGHDPFSKESTQTRERRRREGRNQANYIGLFIPKYIIIDGFGGAVASDLV